YRANEWHILDMSVDGVSSVESYRRQFQSIIRKRGFEPLLSSLRKRAARNQP
ncbi:MAG: ABC transporter substrate-binding protein, partial [Balneolaceae bacterium]